MWENFFIIVISTLFSTLLATWFAYQRFINEKWWEYRVKTYEKIIESLYHIKKYVDNSCTELQYERYGHEREENNCKSKQLSEDEYKKYQQKLVQQKTDNMVHMAEVEKTLREKKKLSLEEIDRLIDVSEFIINEDARKTLIVFREEWENGIFEDEDIEEGIERLLLLVSDCLSTFNKIRRDDLSIRHNFLRLKFQQTIEIIVGWAKRNVPTKHL